jgi:uncharacterized FlaG/YvyC family protein
VIGGTPGTGWLSHVPLVLTLVTMTAVGYSRLHSLEESKEIDEQRDAALDAERQRHEERIRALENSRELERIVQQLSTKVETLNTKVQDLSDELRRGRRGE